MNTNMNPDCRNGKHRACGGEGWDEASAAPTAGNCLCHERAVDTIRNVSQLAFTLGLALAPFQTSVLRAALFERRRLTDPRGYHAAVKLYRETTLTFEEAWDCVRTASDGLHIHVQILEPPDDHPHPDKRTAALAAKAARGSGPPPAASWRGRERSTKFRSQS
ncbi:hypothetical protein [Arthrobacter glacialis]|uniref:hypothetical protein n=1 Tax=Arthrobacter glacialis TaxID=1664 RepID=UPI000CD3E004|nr:hypothetical protein [Arthrobacter glacialis]POH58903.1 hypothetical protein CVS28_09345 [Arthrobacter glacialis]